MKHYFLFRNYPDYVNKYATVVGTAHAIKYSTMSTSLMK